MTPEQIDLARQLVTSPHWRWLSGCRWRFDLPHHADLWQVHDPLWIDEDGVVLKNTPPTARGRVVIDLSDPATVGCIAHLVIEAWGAAPVYVRPSLNRRWYICAPNPAGRQEDTRTAADADQAIVQRPILHHRPGKNAFFEGCGVKHGNECGAKRTAPLHTAVVFAVAEITAANHDNDSAALVVEYQHGALQIGRGHGIGITGFQRAGLVAAAEILKSFIAIPRPLLDFGQPALQGGLGLALHLGIDRGVNTESAVHGTLEAE